MVRSGNQRAVGDAKVADFAPFVALVVAILLHSAAHTPCGSTPVATPGSDARALGARIGRVSDPMECCWRKASRAGNGPRFKLVAGPAIVALVFAGLFGARGENIQITIFEAAMGPQIGGAIVAIDHDLDPALVTLMVGVGIPSRF